MSYGTNNTATTVLLLRTIILATIEVKAKADARSKYTDIPTLILFGGTALVQFCSTCDEGDDQNNYGYYKKND